MQGDEGAPTPGSTCGRFADGLFASRPATRSSSSPGCTRARREVLQVHPRSESAQSSDRRVRDALPRPAESLGLHPVTVRAIDGGTLRVGPIEAIDGTPVVDIKPVL